MYTTRFYGQDFYTLVTFRPITLQKQQCSQIPKSPGPLGVKELIHDSLLMSKAHFLVIKVEAPIVSHVQ